MIKTIITDCGNELESFNLCRNQKNKTGPLCMSIQLDFQNK